MICRYGDSDAAYVLGALDPHDLAVYEVHLTGCAQCRSAVAELAWMPGLLASVPAGAAGQVPPAPAALLPALLTEVRAERRTGRIRQVLTVIAATAATAVAVAVWPLGGGSTPPAASTAPIELVAAPGVPVTASVYLTPRAWGTSVDTRCLYDGPAPDGSADVELVQYQLFAIDDNGTETVVSSWTSLPGRETDVPGGTRLAVTDIDRLEIRTENGVTVSSSP